MYEHKLAEYIKNDDYDEIERMIASVPDKAITCHKRGLLAYDELRSRFGSELLGIRWYNVLSAVEADFIFDSTRVMLEMILEAGKIRNAWRRGLI